MFTYNNFVCEQLVIGNRNQQCKIQVDKLNGLTNSLFSNCISQHIISLSKLTGKPRQCRMHKNKTIFQQV